MLPAARRGKAWVLRSHEHILLKDVDQAIRLPLLCVETNTSSRFPGRLTDVHCITSSWVTTARWSVAYLYHPGALRRRLIFAGVIKGFVTPRTVPLSSCFHSSCSFIPLTGKYNKQCCAVVQLHLLDKLQLST